LRAIKSLIQKITIQKNKRLPAERYVISSSDMIDKKGDVAPRSNKKDAPFLHILFFLRLKASRRNGDPAKAELLLWEEEQSEGKRKGCSEFLQP